MAKEETSPTYSLKGWKFAKWWELNKSRVRLLVAGVAGLIIQAWPENPVLKIVFGGGGAAVIMLILDTVDFYFSEV